MPCFIEFWSSQLNFRGPRGDPPPVHDASVLPNPKPQPSTTSASTSSTLFQEFCPIHTRSPSELDLGAGQGALCFINPLFLQEHPIRGAMHKRHHFKRSIKVRVSTETTSSLSPPISPPPPPPLHAKDKGKEKKLEQTEVVQTNEDKSHVKVAEEDSDYLQPCLALPKKNSTIVTPSLSPTAEEDYQSPKALVQVYILCHQSHLKVNSDLPSAYFILPFQCSEYNTLIKYSAQQSFLFMVTLFV